MPKLYLFAIGGTGSRVVKSLTMLLASGVKSNYEIVPIILDPDAAAADVARTTRLLNNYRSINKYVHATNDDSFFKNKIESLGDVVGAATGEAISNEFRLNIADLNGGTFRKFIDFNALDDQNKALISLLFSNHNLDLDLEVGFQGNPNIGSVVLNKFTESQEFLQFAQAYQAEDKIFIISSIFGGTGAAGFPLILKNIREGKVQGLYFDSLKNAVVGAITVLPYFKLDGDTTEAIQSSSFISKTKAALSYYHANITNNKSINTLYYIGDSANNNYKNVVGGSEQKNDAHFIELASALAVLDFANDMAQSSAHGKANDPKYKEFGIDNIDQSNPVVTFSNLSQATQQYLKVNLSQLYFFSLYNDNKLRSQFSAPFAANAPKIDDNFTNSHFYNAITSFLAEYKIWLGELQRNKISFAPFVFQTNMDDDGNVTGLTSVSKDIFTLINGISKKSKGLLSGFGMKSYDIITSKMSKLDKESNYSNVESKFLDLFSKATKESINQELF
jgi:uncharacterized membrane protein YeaQ/YmgE (transglycosylase-associated protein family)